MVETNRMFLLGAGASVEAGLPTARQMTEKLKARVDRDAKFAWCRPVLDFVVGRLREDPRRPAGGELDIEAVLNALTLIQGRGTSELAPFVATWDPALAQFDADNPSSNGPEIFRQVREVLLGLVTDIAWLDDEQMEKVAYLAPMLLCRSGVHYCDVATLNYDNSVELACKRAGLSYTDCLGDDGEYRYDLRQDLEILHLHGSIAWTSQDPPGTPETAMPYQRIWRASPGAIRQDTYSPAILFGGANKLTARGPYLGVLRAFEVALNVATELIVIGYSFRDGHVNEYIARWLSEHPDSRIVVIDPSFHSSSVPFTRYLQDLPSDRLTVVELGTGEGLARLFRN